MGLGVLGLALLLTRVRLRMRLRVRLRVRLRAMLITTALGNVLSLNINADRASRLLAGAADHISIEVKGDLNVEDASNGATFLVLTDVTLANAAVRLRANLKLNIKINEARLQLGGTRTSLAKNININVLVAASPTVLVTTFLGHSSSVYSLARIFEEFF